MFENEMKEILDLVLEISTKTDASVSCHMTMTVKAKRLVFLQRESCLLYQTESSW